MNRIDFLPSRLVNASWLAWLAATTVLVAQSALTVPWRLAAVGAVLATAILPLWRYVFLRGDRAVRAVEWSAAEQGAYYVCLGTPERRLAATPAGCHRYGPYLWVLRFQTGEGRAQLLVDARCQDPRMLRRLARCLFGAGRPIPVDRAARRRQADTIRAKV